MGVAINYQEMICGNPKKTGCTFLVEICCSKNDLNFLRQLFFYDCTDPQMLDQKSNDWRSIFLWLNIVLNLKRK